MSPFRLARAIAALSFAGASAAALATGCGADQGIVGGACASGYTQCGDRCVDLETDPGNCGECGHACSFGVECAVGACGGQEDEASLEGSSDGSADGATTDSTIDDGGSTADGFGNDGFAGDALVPDSSVSDSASGDSFVGDSTIGDGSVVDSSVVDSSVGDSSVGDSSVGDSSVGDSSVGDSSVVDGAASDGSLDESTLAEASVIDGAVDTDSACPAGVYDTPQGCGDCFTVCSGATPVCAPDDGGFACVPTCSAPLTSCGGACVDMSSDAANCGGCGISCPSQICESSQCIGGTSGSLLFLGHDFASATAKTEPEVLTNAVFIPRTNPVRVLNYDHYADPTAVARIGSILMNSAPAGRTSLVTNTAIDADIPSMLSLLNYDVLLVPDQPNAPSGALGMLGPASGGNWATTLAAFVGTGGVVVVLDGGTGVGEMPEFVTGTGLLTVSAQTPISPLLFLDDLAGGDVESNGLVAPYRAGANSVSVTTEANGGSVTYVIVTSPDAGPSAPVVIHKVF